MSQATEREAATLGYIPGNEPGAGRSRLGSPALVSQRRDGGRDEGTDTQEGEPSLCGLRWKAFLPRLP